MFEASGIIKFISLFPGVMNCFFFLICWDLLESLSSSLLVPFSFGPIFWTSCLFLFWDYLPRIFHLPALLCFTWWVLGPVVELSFFKLTFPLCCVGSPVSCFPCFPSLFWRSTSCSSLLWNRTRKANFLRPRMPENTFIPPSSLTGILEIISPWCPEGIATSPSQFHCSFWEVGCYFHSWSLCANFF